MPWTGGLARTWMTTGRRDTPVQTWTVYDGANPYADFNSAGTLQTRFVYGPAVDEILPRNSAGGVTGWYLTDRLGTVARRRQRHRHGPRPHPLRQLRQHHQRNQPHQRRPIQIHRTRVGRHSGVVLLQGKVLRSSDGEVCEPGSNRIQGGGYQFVSVRWECTEPRH